MKITAIKTFSGTFGNRSRGLIKVETDEGLYGWGEAYSVGPDRAIEPIADYIFEMIKGEDPRRIEYIMLKLTQQFRFPPGGVGLAWPVLAGRPWPGQSGPSLAGDGGVGRGAR